MISATTDLFLLRLVDPRQSGKQLGGFLDGPSLGKLMAASTRFRDLISVEDNVLWREACERLGMKQKGSRSRGSKTWRKTYAENLCIECLQPGFLLIETACSWEASATRPLCRACLEHIQSFNSYSDRRKNCLLRFVVRGIRGAQVPHRVLADLVLSKIPTTKDAAKSRKLKGEEGFESPFVNDSLVPRAKKARSPQSKSVKVNK